MVKADCEEEDITSNNSKLGTFETDYGMNKLTMPTFETVEGAVNLLVIGDNRIGKTTFINSILNDDFINKPIIEYKHTKS